jgi:LytS/YehU family sensor histidine kinase
VPAIFLAYFLTTFRISKERKKEVQELKEENRQAEIQALKEQISPHFLFNTFNSLSALIRTDKKTESLEFIQSLSEVYRYILESQHKNLVSISEELKFLKAYIYLLQKRFEHNLVVTILMDENKIQDSIPPLALQTLVENAVKHNKLTNKVPLEIKIERTADCIEVQNNYNPKVIIESSGIGLINLAKRFHLISNQEIKIYKDDKIFSVTIPIVPS